MSSLRIGLLVSGALHVAVVAAIAQSPREPMPAVQQPRPLAMKLAMFEPSPPPPEVQALVEEIRVPRGSDEAHEISA